MKPPTARIPARYRITAPGPVSGGVYGVGFANGHAIADEDKHRKALAWFRDQPGYTVEPIDDPVPAVVEPEAAGDAEDADDEAAVEVAAETEEGPKWL